ncbi:MAG: hypothetical protein QM536_03680 [Chitinophagaceae bacterium]|nr:hypothetical protein [Chitinophagaceae bacterium]
MNFSKLFICITFFYFYEKADAQFLKEYNFIIEPTKLYIFDEHYNGYMTSFDISEKELKKKWWQYIHKRFTVSLHKTFWVLQIKPLKNKERVHPIICYSSFTENENKVEMKLVFNDDNMKEDNTKKYSEQTKLLLLEFKIVVFQKKIQTEISFIEKEIKTDSKKLHGILKKLKNISNTDIKTEEIKKLEEEKNFYKKNINNNLHKIEEIKYLLINKRSNIIL